MSLEIENSGYFIPSVEPTLKVFDFATASIPTASPTMIRTHAPSIVITNTQLEIFLPILFFFTLVGLVLFYFCCCGSTNEKPDDDTVLIEPVGETETLFDSNTTETNLNDSIPRRKSISSPYLPIPTFQSQTLSTSQPKFRLTIVRPQGAPVRNDLELGNRFTNPQVGLLFYGTVHLGYEKQLTQNEGYVRFRVEDGWISEFTVIGERICQWEEIIVQPNSYLNSLNQSPYFSDPPKLASPLPSSTSPTPT